MNLTEKDVSDIQEAVDTSTIFYDHNYKVELMHKLEDTNILKNQEDAEKYDKHMRDQHSCGTGEIEYQRVFEIVERLKKQIELADRMDYSTVWKKSLQKILDDK